MKWKQLTALLLSNFHLKDQICAVSIPHCSFETFENNGFIRVSFAFGRMSSEFFFMLTGSYKEDETWEDDVRQCCHIWFTNIHRKLLLKMYLATLTERGKQLNVPLGSQMLQFKNKMESMFSLVCCCCCFVVLLFFYFMKEKTNAQIVDTMQVKEVILEFYYYNANHAPLEKNAPADYMK